MARLEHLLPAVLASLGIGAACTNPEGSQPRSVAPRLGQRTPAMISHLAAACPAKLQWSTEHSVSCALDASGAAFVVELDPADRVSAIELRRHRDDEALLRSFDTAISPIVPAEIRAHLRASISTLPPDVRRDGSSSSGLLVAYDDGSVLQVIWLLPDATTRPAWGAFKNVMWHYLTPLGLKTRSP